VIVSLLVGRRLRPRGPMARRRRPMETRWYQCLGYPFRDAALWVGPALLLTPLTAAALLVLPWLIAQPPADPGARWAAAAACLLGLVLLIGLPGNFLIGVLGSASSGGTDSRWHGYTLVGVLKCGALWLGCLLPGPVVPAGAAFWYWVQCGDPILLDWLILGELAIFTVGYGLFVLAAVAERGRLRDANPIRVIDLAHRLGYRAAVVVVLGTALVVAHGFLLALAAQELHRTGLGLLLLAACDLSGLFWAAFLFRLLGMWCHRTRPAPA
jgi:hypothetical protein